MGRPFAEEVAELEKTHFQARHAAVDVLSDSIQKLLHYPLLAVGSGGSLTTASIAATLCRDLAHRLSMAITPLELANKRFALRNSSVFIATAGGSNPDAIGALRTAAESEAQNILALCTKVGSKLSTEAAKFSNVNVAEFEFAVSSDGFLATNSLWGSAVTLFRGFSLAVGLSYEVSPRLSRLVGKPNWPTFVRSVCEAATPLWDRETVLVLYGAASYPAAVDLESKLTEAALSNVWIADYRHFAHGRHHWLAKRGAKSSIIAFISDSDSELAKRTLNEIPSDIPQLRIQIPSDPTALLTALAYVFPITMSAGIARGIDPGRPGVPAFGRRIYKLNAYGKLASKQITSPGSQFVAIERKASVPIAELELREDFQDWQDSYNDFLNRLQAIQFGAIVFDYDGTLCGPAERLKGLRQDVSAELARLLRAGVRIGIATGRGKSVRAALRDSIAKKYWSKVTVGYYNGGQIGLLNEDDLPDGTQLVDECLASVLAVLESEPRLGKLAIVEGRRTQITIKARHPNLIEKCWSILVHITHLISLSNIKLFRSSHSFDIVPTTISKLAVVQAARRDGSEVLAVGDMGKWPGNDSELLSHPFSLSVDQVSPDPSTCWNLAPAGVSGVDAVVFYFRNMTVTKKGHMRIRFTKNRRG